MKNSNIRKKVKKVKNTITTEQLEKMRYFLIAVEITAHIPVDDTTAKEDVFIDTDIIITPTGIDEQQILEYLTKKHKDKTILTIRTLSFSEFKTLSDFDQWVRNRVSK